MSSAVSRSESPNLPVKSLAANAKPFWTSCCALAAFSRMAVPRCRRDRRGAGSRTSKPEFHPREFRAGANERAREGLGSKLDVKKLLAPCTKEAMPPLPANPSVPKRGYIDQPPDPQAARSG